MNQLELQPTSVFFFNVCHMVQVFTKDVDRDTVILLGARASRVENQDAIDACIVGMLADPREV